MTCCCFKMTFTESEDFRACFSESEDFKACFGETTTILPDPYPGPYVVIPKRRDQVLSTKNKTMGGDVTVKEVPWIEVSNPEGTTYIIASD